MSWIDDARRVLTGCGLESHAAGLSRPQAREILEIARAVTASKDTGDVLDMVRSDRNVRAALRDVLNRFATEENFGARNREGRRLGFFAGVAFTLAAAVLVAAGPRLFPDFVDTLPVLLQDPLILDAAAVVLGGLSMLVRDSVSLASGGHARPAPAAHPAGARRNGGNQGLSGLTRRTALRSRLCAALRPG